MRVKCKYCRLMINALGVEAHERKCIGLRRLKRAEEAKKRLPVVVPIIEPIPEPKRKLGGKK